MIAPPVLDRAGEVRAETLAQFANAEATESILAAERRADEALARANAEGLRLLARVQKVRGLLGQCVRLRHSANEGRSLAQSVDPLSQAKAVVQHYATPGGEQSLWMVPLIHGGALVTMQPFLIKASEGLDDEASEIEKQLAKEIADKEIIFSEIAAEFRSQNAAYAAEVDDVLARLEAK